jgi:hypothetical protein
MQTYTQETGRENLQTNAADILPLGKELVSFNIHILLCYATLLQDNSWSGYQFSVSLINVKSI